MKSETQRLRRTKSIGNEEGLQEGRKKKKIHNTKKAKRLKKNLL